MLNRFRDKLPSFSFSLSTSPDRIQTWQYVVLGLFVFFACFYGLSSYAILDMNEGLYAEIAREMLTTHHWIIPYLNDVPYLEKPPLLYWLIALSYKFFGVNAFAARLVPSISFALTALITFYFGKKCEAPRTGFIAAIILLSSIVLVLIGRTVFFDMLLTYFICGSLFFFYLWHQKDKAGYLYASYIFLALAILTKGFLALVLLPLIMLIFMVLGRSEKSKYISLFNKKAIILFLIIALPWHILAMVSFPSFTWEYFINNQLLRFFNTRLPHDYHTGPIYFYLPRVIAYLLPWAIFIPFTIMKKLDPLKIFLWVWFLVMLVFFSLSGDKGDYYMVIGIVPMAYLIAQKIEEWFVEGKTRWLSLGFYLIALLLIAAGIIGLVFYQSSRANYAGQFSGDKIPFILNGSVTFLVMTLIIYLIAGFYLIRKNLTNPIIPFLFIAGLVIPLTFFYLSVREKTQFMYSQISLAKYVQTQYEHRPIYLYQDFEAMSSLVFYNQEPSIIVDNKSSDLYFGAHLKDNSDKFITIDDFAKKAKNTYIYIAMKFNKLPEFEKIVGKDVFCTVQRNGNILLLSNVPEDCHATIEQGEKKELNIDSLISKKK